MRTLLLSVLALALTIGPQAAWADARIASFTNPAAAARPAGEGGKGSTLPTSVVADPDTIDAGETLVNVSRRLTVFFYNGYRSPVQLGEVTISSDGNVRSKIVANDCATLKALPVGDRCSIAVEVVPNSPGPWTVELLVNHTGQGRIARAELMGSTLGKTGEKTEGLAISKKIAPPLDFGAVLASEEHSTRTMLIENDSNNQLVISKIDLISQQGDGLKLRDSGCKEGDQLKPGESCPITVMWEPKDKQNLATDLIVRHNGDLGFVVVPIRGSAKVAEAEKGKDGGSGDASGNARNTAPTVVTSSQVVSPPAGLLPAISQLAQSLPQIQSDRLGKDGAKAEAKAPVLPAGATVKLDLIGTVGGRAILGGETSQTAIVGLGETVPFEGSNVELLQLESSRAVVNVNGVRRELGLRRATSYMLGTSTGTGGSGSKNTSKDNTDTSSSNPPPPQNNTPAAAATSSAAPANTTDTKTDQKNSSSIFPNSIFDEKVKGTTTNKTSSIPAAAADAVKSALLGE